MDKSIFRYIWQHSRREQVLLLVLALVSLPFYFYSMDIPKYIVNDAIQGRAFSGGKTSITVMTIAISLPSWLGGARWVLFDGFDVSRMTYLFWLSGLFLLLVLINGAFKFVINVRKGTLGEALLRGLRFDLFSLLVRFTPEALRDVKPSEAATIIKDEVEPIGGFVGDAFITPALLASQAATALFFILLQSFWLGLIAGGVVFIQGIIIPRLRREQLKLSRQRQIESRALAGRIGEVVEGIAAVQSHGTTTFEKWRIDQRLVLLFSIRNRLFVRKFAVKFANNMLAQMTPFVFYSLGGYLALTGRLDLGQLVAVIAAYRELPPPIKELIDWDQQRLDVQVKYDQIVEQFSAPLWSQGDPGCDELQLGEGPLEFANVRMVDSHGAPLLDNVSFSFPLGSHVAFTSPKGEAPAVAGRILGRLISVYAGEVRLAGVPLADLTERSAGRLIGYAGPDPVVFFGSIRDNVLYGLNRADNGWSAGRDLSPEAWIDYGAVDADGPEALDLRIIEALRLVGMDESVFRYGLSGTLDPARAVELSEGILGARAYIRERLEATGDAGLVESFDPLRYNMNATLGENLVFGVPIGKTAVDTDILEQDVIRKLIVDEGLLEPLKEMGRSIAETMVDIFADLPSDHYLFEQYSFVSAADLPEFAELLKAIERGDALKDAEIWSFVGVTFNYIEPRHRLGLVGPELAERIVAARRRLMTDIGMAASGIEFFDPERLCISAPVRDNLLFGRITYGAAGAEQKVFAVLRESIRALELEPQLYRLGLDFQTGNGGRRLTPAQRAAVSVARTLVKRPSLFILENALASFGEGDRRAILEHVRHCMAGKTLVVIAQEEPRAEDYDVIVHFTGAKVTRVETGARALETQNDPNNSVLVVEQSGTAKADPAAAAE
ncbi:MAG: ABC transporter transmembrane domain-containing protein [Alsobacter sp.]